MLSSFSQVTTHQVRASHPEQLEPKECAHECLNCSVSDSCKSRQKKPGIHEVSAVIGLDLTVSRMKDSIG